MIFKCAICDGPIADDSCSVCGLVHTLDPVQRQLLTLPLLEPFEKNLAKPQKVIPFVDFDETRFKVFAIHNTTRCFNCYTTPNLIQPIARSEF
jgi:hypothetical protein